MLPTPGPIDDHGPPPPFRGLSIILGLVIEDPFDNCRIIKRLPPDGLVFADPDGTHWCVTVRRDIQ